MLHYHLCSSWLSQRITYFDISKHVTAVRCATVFFLLGRVPADLAVAVIVAVDVAVVVATFVSCDC